MEHKIITELPRARGDRRINTFFSRTPERRKKQRREKVSN